MPHSVEMDEKSPAGLVKDEPMEDTDIPSDVQATGDNDGDAKMDDGPDTNGEGSSKNDVKLDDLFADVESDDEFPSSAPIKNEVASSPEQAPASPT